jgi:hypothetical protein
MGLVTQYSRLAHHTIFGLTGSTFSVPTSEDFTDGSWTIYDLALSEIGVNETDEKAYIRIGNTIKEFNFGTGSGGGTVSVSASNGLSISSGDVVLGGTLTGDTVIQGASYGLSLGESVTPSRLRTFGVETYDGIFIRDDDSFNLSVLDMSASGGSSILSSAEQISGSGVEFYAGAYGRAYIEATDGTNIFKIELDAESTNTMVVTDTITSRGLQYAADYSAQFITHSLVTKGYVDSQISNATQSLSEVLAVGNFAATYSIRMGTGKIISTNNISSLSLSDSAFNVNSGTVSQTNPNVTHTSPIYTLIIEAITTTASTQRLWSFDVNELGTADALFNYEYTGQGFDIVSGNVYVEKTNGALSCIGGTWSSTPIITQNVNNTTFGGSASLIFDTDLAQLIYIDALGESGTTIRWSARLNYFYTTF